MRVAHLLRKYNPAEWGGTETAIQRLFDGLRKQGVTSVVYCPQIKTNDCSSDPLQSAGCQIKRFSGLRADLGNLGAEKREMISVGGNLMSFDLMSSLVAGTGIVAHPYSRARAALGRSA